MTAITRAESTSTPPAGVQVAKVDYSDHSSLVKAFTGQEALIITMGVTAPPDQQSKLIAAATEAKVSWILPNEWGFDAKNEQLVIDIMGANHYGQIHQQIEQSGSSSWIGIACGFWYEFSVKNGPECYGFDLKDHKAIFIDNGETKINTSTWPQCGRAVANLLSLKILPDDESDKSAHLSQFKNEAVYISSFLLSQKEMLASIQRVTNTTDKDWTIEHQDHKERYESGQKIMKEGNRLGFARLMYTRMFYPNGDGNYEANRTLANGALGLPKEDLDEATKKAVELYEKEGGYSYANY